MFRRRHRTDFVEVFDVETQRPLKRIRRKARTSGNKYLYALLGVASAGSYAYTRSRKRVTAPRPKEKKEETTKVKQKVATSKKSLSKMPYGRKRKYRTRKRKRSASGKRRSKYSRRYKRPSVYHIKNKLQSIMAPENTLRIASSQSVECLSSNCAIFFTSHALHGSYIYQQIGAAAGENDAFMDSSLAAKTLVTFAQQFHRIRNNTDYPCYIEARVYEPKYDWRDDDYAHDRWGPASSLMDIAYQSLRQELDTTDDATLSVQVKDTNERHYTYMQTPTFAKLGTRGFHTIFKPAGRFKTRKLEPGQTTSFKLVDKKVRPIVRHVHVTGTGNHPIYMFNGRTKFIVFKAFGTTVGTAEIDAGAAESEKVATGSVQLHHEIFDHYVCKSFEPQTTNQEYVENRPGITNDNMRGIVDEDMKLDNIEDL